MMWQWRVNGQWWLREVGVTFHIYAILYPDGRVWWCDKTL